MRYLHLGLSILALILTAVFWLTPSTITAQMRWRYFPETGYWVGGEFLDFFERRGGLDIFGYPIGNETTEEGRRVQYFQRARMELHLDQPDPYRVQLGLLGSLLYQSRYPQPLPTVPPDRIPSPDDPNARYFPETGQVVQGAFWRFFRTRGGLDIFGYPISPEFVENGRPVQYFQRARMEWHPENPEPYKVQLGLLGCEWLTQQLNPTPTTSPIIAAPTAPTAPTVPPTPANVPAGQPPAWELLTGIAAIVTMIILLLSFAVVLQIRRKEEFPAPDQAEGEGPSSFRERWRSLRERMRRAQPGSPIASEPAERQWIIETDEETPQQQGGFEPEEQGQTSAGSSQPPMRSKPLSFRTTPYTDAGLPGSSEGKPTP